MEVVFSASQPLDIFFLLERREVNEEVEARRHFSVYLASGIPPGPTIRVCPFPRLFILP